MQKMTWNSDCLKLFLCRIPMAKEDSGKTASSIFATECNKYVTDICWTTTLWQAKQNRMVFPSVNVSSNHQCLLNIESNLYDSCLWWWRILQFLIIALIVIAIASEITSAFQICWAWQNWPQRYTNAIKWRMDAFNA